MLPLLGSPNDFTDLCVVNSFCIFTRKIQRAGRAFNEIYEASERKSDKANVNKSKSEKKKNVSESDEEYFSKSNYKCKSEFANAGSTKLQKLAKGPILYQVLDVPESASMSDIKKAYRRCALEYHPDKQNSKASSYTPYYPVSERNALFAELDVNQSFLLIQDAYEILSIPSTRKQYDSLLTFDDSIPKAASVDPNNPKSFFEQFAPVFDRNAKWSAKPRVPRLGSMQTPHSEVKKFYAFWRNFETTRDFSIHDKYDITEAECRDERRAMERENYKIKRKYISDENARVLKLAELAYSLDPRIKNFQLEEQKRKEEIKREKFQSKQNKFKTASSVDFKKTSTAPQEDDGIAEFEEIEKLINKLVEGAENIPYLPAKSIAELHTQLDEASLKKLKSLISKFVLLSNSERLKNLDILKEITEIIRIYLPDKSKYLNKLLNVYSQKNDSQADDKPCEGTRDLWTDEELKILAKSIIKYPGGTPRRWQLIANMLESKSIESVIKKSKEIANNKTDNKVTPPSDESTAQPTTADSTKSVETNSDIWSKKQQQALEEALKMFQSIANSKEKWLKISEFVPDKDAKQCLQRYKQIRNAIMEQLKKSHK